MLRPGNVKLPSLRNGRHARVPGASRHATDARALPRPRSDLGREGTAAQRSPAARRPAGAGSKHVLDLDRLLHAAFALQLDAAVLPACRGLGAELDWNRSPDLQPQLYRGGV